MRILSVCRGAPGLGRVMPSVGLCQTLARTRGAETVFASYAAGYRYLDATGRSAHDLTRPDGLFIGSVSAQAIRALEIIEALEPDLVLIDGEFFLTATLAHLTAPVAYIANPHDLIGPDNTFRRVNRLMLSYAQAVIVSSLSCTQAYPVSLPRGVSGLMVPPIIREFSPQRLPGPRRMLITMGGGSIGAAPTFRQATDSALAAVLDAACELIQWGTIAAVTVVLGADGSLPANRSADWLTVEDRAVELTSLYSTHDMLVTRAGRNALAEAMYCGIPTVVLPVTADRYRGSEQASNAAIASSASDHIIAVPEWHRPGALLLALTDAAALTPRTRPKLRGNEHAAQFLAALVASDGALANQRPQLIGRTGE